MSEAVAEAVELVRNTPALRSRVQGTEVVEEAVVQVVLLVSHLSSVVRSDAVREEVAGAVELLVMK